MPSILTNYYYTPTVIDSRWIAPNQYPVLLHKDQFKYDDKSLIKTKSNNRYRRYPCQNFICTGGCPYYDRCSYLHDPRISVKRRIIRTPKLKVMDPKDSFFWPDLNTCMENVSDPYSIPLSFGQNLSDIHNYAMYSMWYYFTNYCFCSEKFGSLEYFDNETKKNEWTSETNANPPLKQRLPVFIKYTTEAIKTRLQEKKAAAIYDRKMELHSLSQALNCVDDVLMIMDSDGEDQTNVDDQYQQHQTRISVASPKANHVFLCSQLMKWDTHW